MNVNFGLKMWSSNSNIIEDAYLLIKNRNFQYIELTPIPSTKFDVFKSFDIPFVIHVPSERWGLNISDPKKSDINNELINFSIDWADALKAKDLILHPGFGDIENALNFLDQINDKRVIIENMPKIGLDGELMVGYSLEQINQLCGEKFGFCLDFNHAIKAAVAQELSYKSYISNLLFLNPCIFHIADGFQSYPKDEHLSIGEGDYDIKFLLSSIINSEKVRITLETPRTSLDDDLNNLKKLHALIR